MLRGSGLGWLSLAAVLVVAPSVGASGPDAVERGSIGPNFRISGLAATGVEAETAIAYNPDDDQFLVVWRDTRNTATSGSDIYGQRLSGSGARLGANFKISGAAALSAEFFPDVAYVPAAGQYFVVWQDHRDSMARGTDVYLQRVSPAGARVGGNVRLSGPTATEDDSVPAIAATAAGGALVVWTDARDRPTRGDDIFGQRVTRNGARLGANLRISGAAATAFDTWPDVAFDPASGEYLVVWMDARDASTRGEDIYGQRVSATGARLGPNVRVSGGLATGLEQFPAVACATSGVCLVAWGDDRDFATRSRDMYAQRIGAGGARLGGNIRVSGGAATGSDRFADVAFEPSSGDFLVLWRTDRDLDTRGWDVVSQWVSAGGAHLGANARVSGGAATGDDYSSVAACRAVGGECLAAWSDNRHEGSTAPDIYGQRLTP